MIQIHLKGVLQSKLDTFISEKYVKVFYDNNFFDVVLYHSIEDNNSKCIVTAENIVLELKKTESIEWVRLEADLPKTESFKLKKDLLKSSFEQFQKQCEQKRIVKAELKRTAVRKQIQSDTEVRNIIENIKQKEKVHALGDAKEWVQNAEQKLSKEFKEVANKCSQDKVIINSIHSDKQESKTDCNILPRQQKTLQVEFTAREFVTPSRESTMEEENVWLTKQAAARRSCGFVSEDIRPEECNPQFVKAKGDELLRNKNYLGAISAYSYGIQISPNFVDFYISRSEINLELGGYNIRTPVNLIVLKNCLKKIIQVYSTKV